MVLADYLAPLLIGFQPAARPMVMPPGALGVRLQTDRNIPPGTVAFKAPVAVQAYDGADLGGLEEVLLGPVGDVATHLLISGPDHRRRLVPIEWVNGISDDEVRLSVPAHAVERLKLYEP